MLFLFFSCLVGCKEGFGYKNMQQMGVGGKVNSLVYPFNKYIFEHSVRDAMLGARNKEINKIRSLLLRLLGVQIFITEMRSPENLKC